MTVTNGIKSEAQAATAPLCLPSAKCSAQVQHLFSCRNHTVTIVIHSAMNFIAIAVFFVGLVNCSMANLQKLSLMEVCDLPDICGEQGKCKTEDHISYCVCEPGFTGKCCESYIPQRCNPHSEDADEGTQLKKELNGNKKTACEKNFWCLSDNFGCHLFHHCENAEGWCVPMAAENQVPDCKVYAKYLHYDPN